MNVDDLQKLEKKLDDAYIYDANERNVVKQKVEFLLKQNENVIDTVNVKLLTTTYDSISNLLSMLTVYPNVQDKIVNLDEKQYKLLNTIINYMDSRDLDWIDITDKYLNNMDSGNYNDLFLDQRFMNKIDMLYDKSQKSSLNDKDEADINKMMVLLTNNNIFEIKNYRQMERINTKRYCNDLLIGNIKGDTKFNRLSKKDKYKDIIFRAQFGYDLKTAEKFIQRYGSDYKEIVKTIESENENKIRDYLVKSRNLIDEDEIQSEIERIKSENTAIKDHLTAVKDIIETDDIDKLKEIYTNINNIDIKNNAYVLDSMFRHFFTREKNKVLYRPKDSDKATIDSMNVYIPKGDFKFSMVSLVAYSTDPPDWDCKLLEFHGMCSTFGANNNLNHAYIKGACLGLTDFNENALLASAPWDLGSWSFSRKMNAAEGIRNNGKEASISYNMPNTQIDKTRKRHGEDVWERRELDSYKIDARNPKYKKQPSYMIYFAEPSLKNYINNLGSKILTSENLKSSLKFHKLYDQNYQNRLIEQYAQNDSCWDATKKEMKKRNLKDIVVIDRTHTALMERLKIDAMEEKLVNFDVSKLNSNEEKINEFMNLFERIIVESENNRAGNSIKTDSKNDKPKHEEILNNLFSTDIMNDRLNKIESKIDSLSPELQKKCYERLRRVVMNEIEKYSHGWDHFEALKGANWEQYLNKIIKKQTLNKSINIKKLLEEYDPDIGKKGGDIVCEAIGDIRDIKEYESSSRAIHGQKHINNVVLFSYLIAKAEGKIQGKNLDLLIQAAKFHDVGRDGKWNGLGDGNRHDGSRVKHADPSALAAEFYMKMDNKKSGVEKYKKEDIAIVQTAISYHEVHEKGCNQFDETKFNELCERYGVKDKENAKLICIYLKDADAVDRTRFRKYNKEDAKNIPESKRYKRRFTDDLQIQYLRTETSLLLADEARNMHKELIKKVCEHMYDKHGNRIKYYPKTMILDILKPYEHTINNRTIKYNAGNVNDINDFLDQKKRKEKINELQELREIYDMQDKSLLARLRRFARNILERLHIRQSEMQR